MQWQLLWLSCLVLFAVTRAAEENRLKGTAPRFSVKSVSSGLRTEKYCALCKAYGTAFGQTVHVVGKMDQKVGKIASQVCGNFTFGVMPASCETIGSGYSDMGDLAVKAGDFMVSDVFCASLFGCPDDDFEVDNLWEAEVNQQSSCETCKLFAELVFSFVDPEKSKLAAKQRTLKFCTRLPAASQSYCSDQVDELFKLVEVPTASDVCKAAGVCPMFEYHYYPA